MGVAEESEMLVDELRDDAEFIAMVGRLHEAAGELIAGEPQSVADFAASLAAVIDRLERQR